jgi:Fur family ferric uptake transcriptional regulator
VGVLEVLSKAARPMTVPQLLGKLKGTDTVTVYRTLNTFVKKRLVHRVRGEDRSWLYATGNSSSAPEHQHPHFVCDSCGKVECLERAHVPEGFAQSMKIERGYRVSWSEVVLHGSCPRCSV